MVKLSQKQQRAFRLTQLSALAGRLEQQLQLVQDQRHVHGVAAESLHPEQEGHRRLELSRQEQHLEIEEGLLAGGEMGLSCWEEDRGRSFILKDLQTGNGLVGHTKSSFHHMPHIRTRTRSSFFILDQSGEVSDDSQSQKKIFSPVFTASSKKYTWLRFFHKTRQAQKVATFTLPLT